MAKPTPNNIINTPIDILRVKTPPKNKSEKTIAVIGSNAPRRAVFVEPINFIATFVVSIDSIVGTSAIKIAQIKTRGEFIPSSCVQNLEFTM